MDNLNELCKNHPDWQAVANMAYALDIYKREVVHELYRRIRRRD